MFKLSPEGCDLIKRCEGLRLTAYQDVVGVWTVGVGHTGSDVNPGLVISEAEADLMLVGDTGHAVSAVNRLVTYPSLTQNQFDALVSFTFNLGVGALEGSTLLRKLNDGDVTGAAAEFLRWTHAGGKEVAGLVTRRKAEQAMFIGGN